MTAYDDNNWVQTLKSLGLTDNEYADAKLLLAEKDAAYRKVMLGDDPESNKNVILRALGESSIPFGCSEEIESCKGCLFQHTLVFDSSKMLPIPIQPISYCAACPVTFPPAPIIPHNCRKGFSCSFR